MKYAFSPWRSLYIDSFAGKKKPGCLFCSMLNETGNDANNLLVWRGEHCFVVMNRFPYNSGHLMIVPNRHTARLEKLKADEQAEIMGTLIRCSSALEQVLHPHGFNIGANIGKVAGAGIDKHLHVHIVPRWNGDTNFMPILADVKVVSQDIEKHRALLAKILDRR